MQTYRALKNIVFPYKALINNMKLLQMILSPCRFRELVSIDYRGTTGSTGGVEYLATTGGGLARTDTLTPGEGYQRPLMYIYGRR